MRTIRTNRLGARMFIRVTGSQQIGVVFGSSFQTSSVSGLTFVPGRVGYRVYAESSFPSPSPYRFTEATGTLICADRLNTATTYICELYVERLGSYFYPSGIEYTDTQRWSEPTTPVDGVYGKFIEVVSVVADPGATIASPTASVPDMKLLIIGDKNADGQLQMTPGKDTWSGYYTKVDSGITQSYAHVAASRLADYEQSVPTIRYATRPDGSFIDLTASAFPWTLAGNVTYTSEANYRSGMGIDLDDGKTISTGPNYSYGGWIKDQVTQLVDGVPNTEIPDFVFIALGAWDQKLENPINMDWANKVAAGVNDMIATLYTAWPHTTFIVMLPPTGLLGSETDVVDKAIIEAVNQLYLASVPVFSVELKSETLTPEGLSLAPWGSILTPAQSYFLGQKSANQLINQRATVTISVT